MMYEEVIKNREKMIDYDLSKYIKIRREIKQSIFLHLEASDALSLYVQTQG